MTLRRPNTLAARERRTQRARIAALFAGLRTCYRAGQRVLKAVASFFSSLLAPLTPPGHHQMQASFEERVTRAQRLLTGDLRAAEKETAGKRLTWLEQAGFPEAPEWPELRSPADGSSATARRAVSPRQAYELLFRDYMGLDLLELPVVEESDSHVTWLSRNACPTLEACSRLGLDTREVCRVVYEKPTQLFLSRLDPSLRFVRDYSAIRPYAPHCRESIVRLDLDGLMREAIAEAWAAKAEGNKGYGAAIVLGDRTVAQAHDSITTDRDPSKHGELKVICEAAATLGSPDLCGALLLSTCEPCPMCAGLAIWANVTTIIYGSSIADTAAMGRTRIMVEAAEIAQRSPFTIEVFGGLLKTECDSLYV